jgi:hypothetical protein
MRGRIGSDERRRAMQATYEKWWLGKYVNHLYSDKPFRKVIAIEFVAPPSGIYGDVWLTFEDGEREPIMPHYTGQCLWGQVYRPRKRDLAVKE